MVDDGDPELRERARARLGTLLRDKYRLESVLGAGGMAVVYAATHRNQKRFAVKILHAELSLRSDVRQRFLREGYAANTLNHPGAVSIVDEDLAEDGSAFLVMELLEGAPLERAAQLLGGHLPVPAVIAIAQQLLDVLGVAHAKAIVHRDIKPANLFLLRDGTLKVLDFGIARIRDATGSGASATSTGAMLGTPAFMAPEQAGGRSSEVDGTTDVWSVGATLFTLLSGHFVHVGESATQMAIRAATERARPLSSVFPEAPAPLAAVIDRALEFRKEDRWASASAMNAALAAAQLELYGAPTSKAPLVRLMEELDSRAGADRGEALAPTVAAPSTPARTPSSEPLPPRASGPHPSEASSGSTATPALSPSSSTLSAPRRARPWGLVASGAAVLAAVTGVAVVSSRSPAGRNAPPATATAATSVASSQPPSPAPVAASSGSTVLVAPTQRLAVVPPGASVEVDGKPAPVTSGSVEIAGAPGSMHLVHLIAGKRDGTYPVLLTERGPVPPQVELAMAGAASAARPAAASAARPAAPAASAASAAPRASSDSVSRTFE